MAADITHGVDFYKGHKPGRDLVTFLQWSILSKTVTETLCYEIIINIA